jgi:steroid delta-isomerase
MARDSTTAATVSAYFAAIRAMDKAAWVATFAQDGENHDPYGSPPNRGHAALGAFFDGIVGMTSSIGLHEDHVYVSGSGAAVKWTGRGVGKNGKPFIFEGIDVFEMNERGKIQRLLAYWDPSKLMAQLQ